MDFILGTATFGSAYGIANNGTELPESSAIDILDRALKFGIEVLDTSPDYADAELVIGKFHLDHKKFRVHSKISRNIPFNSTSILAALESSLLRLKVDQLEVAYFHDPDSLLECSVQEVKTVIEDILESGMVKFLGASVYTESQISRIANKYPKIGIFQVPENILDQRLLESEIVHKLSISGYKFFVRSIFLQGLLLMDPESLPLNLIAAKDNLKEFHEIAYSLNFSPLEASLGYLFELGWASGFLVGISEVSQLEELYQAQTRQFPILKLPKPLTTELIDPRNWKVL
jgi:aryl-alcohol dehydrogenase-like predicted oxidoreductase